MEDNRYKKIGTEKVKTFQENFDTLLKEYKDKAVASGYSGELKFVIERGKVLFYVVI